MLLKNGGNWRRCSYQLFIIIHMRKIRDFNVVHTSSFIVLLPPFFFLPLSHYCKSALLEQVWRHSKGEHDYFPPADSLFGLFFCFFYTKLCSIKSHMWSIKFSSSIYCKGDEIFFFFLCFNITKDVKPNIYYSYFQRLFFCTYQNT